MRKSIVSTFLICFTLAFICLVLSSAQELTLHEDALSLTFTPLEDTKTYDLASFPFTVAETGADCKDAEDAVVATVDADGVITYEEDVDPVACQFAVSTYVPADLPLIIPTAAGGFVPIRRTLVNQPTYDEDNLIYEFTINADISTPISTMTLVFTFQKNSAPSEFQVFVNDSGSSGNGGYVTLSPDDGDDVVTFTLDQFPSISPVQAKIVNKSYAESMSATLSYHYDGRAVDISSPLAIPVTAMPSPTIAGQDDCPTYTDSTCGLQLTISGTDIAPVSYIAIRLTEAAAAAIDEIDLVCGSGDAQTTTALTFDADELTHSHTAPDTIPVTTLTTCQFQLQLSSSSPSDTASRQAQLLLGVAANNAQQFQFTLPSFAVLFSIHQGEDCLDASVQSCTLTISDADTPFDFTLNAIPALDVDAVTGATLTVEDSLYTITPAGNGAPIVIPITLDPASALTGAIQLMNDDVAGPSFTIPLLYVREEDPKPIIVNASDHCQDSAIPDCTLIWNIPSSITQFTIVGHYGESGECKDGDNVVGTFTKTGTSLQFIRQLNAPNAPCQFTTVKPAAGYPASSLRVSEYNNFTLPTAVTAFVVEHPVVAPTGVLSLAHGQDCEDFTLDTCTITFTFTKTDVVSLSFDSIPFGVTDVTEGVTCTTGLTVAADDADGFEITTETVFPTTIECVFTSATPGFTPQTPVVINAVRQGEDSPQSIDASWPYYRTGQPLSLTADAGCTAGNVEECNITFTFHYNFDKLTAIEAYNGFNFGSLPCEESGASLGVFGLNNNSKILTFTREDSANISGKTCTVAFPKGSLTVETKLPFYLETIQDYTFLLPLPTVNKGSITVIPGANCRGGLVCDITYNILEEINSFELDNHYELVQGQQLPCVAPTGDDDDAPAVLVMTAALNAEGRIVFQRPNENGTGTTCTIKIPLLPSTLKHGKKLLHAYNGITDLIDVPAFYKTPPLQLASAYCRVGDSCHVQLVIHPTLYTKSIVGRLAFPEDSFVSASFLPGENGVTTCLISSTRPDGFVFSILSRLPCVIDLHLKKSIAPDTAMGEYFYCIVDKDNNCLEPIQDVFTVPHSYVYPAGDLVEVTTPSSCTGAESCRVTYKITGKGVSAIRIENFYDMPYGTPLDCIVPAEEGAEDVKVGIVHRPNQATDYIVLTRVLADENTSPVFPVGTTCSVTYQILTSAASREVEHSYEIYDVDYHPELDQKVYFGSDKIHYKSYSSFSLEYTGSIYPGSVNSYLTFTMKYANDDQHTHMQINAITLPIVTSKQVTQTACFVVDPSPERTLFGSDSPAADLVCNVSIQYDQSIVSFTGTEHRDKPIEQFYLSVSTKSWEDDSALDLPASSSALVHFTTTNTAGIVRTHIITVDLEHKGGENLSPGKAFKPSIKTSASASPDSGIFFFRGNPTELHIDYNGFPLQAGDLVMFEFRPIGFDRSIRFIPGTTGSNHIPNPPPNHEFVEEIYYRQLVYKFTGTDSSGTHPFSFIYDDVYTDTKMIVVITLVREVQPLGNASVQLDFSLQSITVMNQFYYADFSITKAVFAVAGGSQNAPLTENEIALHGHATPGEFRIYASTPDYFIRTTPANWPTVKVQLAIENLFVPLDEDDAAVAITPDLPSGHACTHDAANHSVTCDYDVMSNDQHFVSIPITTPTVTKNVYSYQYTITVKFVVDYEDGDQQTISLPQSFSTVPIVKPESLTFYNGDVICHDNTTPTLLAALKHSSPVLPAEFILQWPSSSPFTFEAGSSSYYDVIRQPYGQYIRNIIRIRRLPPSRVVPIYSRFSCDDTNTVAITDILADTTLTLRYYDQRNDENATEIDTPVFRRYHHIFRSTDDSRFIFVDSNDSDVDVDVGGNITIKLKVQTSIERNTILQFRPSLSAQYPLFEVAKSRVAFTYTTFNGNEDEQVTLMARIIHVADDSPRIHLTFDEAVTIYSQTEPVVAPQAGALTLQFKAHNHYSNDIIIDRCQVGTSCFPVSSFRVNALAKFDYHAQFYLEHGFPTINQLYINRRFKKDDKIVLTFPSTIVKPTAFNAGQMDLFSFEDLGIDTYYKYQSSLTSVTLTFNTDYEPLQLIHVPVYSEFVSSDEDTNTGFGTVAIDVTVTIVNEVENETIKFKINAPTLNRRAIEIVSPQPFYRADTTAPISIKINRAFLKGQRLVTNNLPFKIPHAASHHDGFIISYSSVSIPNSMSYAKLTILATRDHPPGSTLEFTAMVQNVPIPITPEGQQQTGNDGPFATYFPQNAKAVIDGTDVTYPATPNLAVPAFWDFSSSSLGEHGATLMNYASSDFIRLYQPFLPEILSGEQFVQNEKTSLTLRVLNVSYASQCLAFRFDKAGYAIAPKNEQNAGTPTKPVQGESITWYITDDVLYIIFGAQSNDRPSTGPQEFVIDGFTFTTPKLHPFSFDLELYSTTQCLDLEAVASVPAPLVLPSDVGITFFPLSLFESNVNTIFGMKLNYPLKSNSLQHPSGFALKFPQTESTLMRQGTPQLIFVDGAQKIATISFDQSSNTLAFNIDSNFHGFLGLNEPLAFKQDLDLFSTLPQLPCTEQAEDQCVEVQILSSHNEVLAKSLVKFMPANVPKDLDYFGTASVSDEIRVGDFYAFVNTQRDYTFLIQRKGASLIGSDLEIHVPRVYELTDVVTAFCQASNGGVFTSMAYTYSTDDFHVFTILYHPTEAATSSYECKLPLIPTRVSTGDNDRIAKITTIHTDADESGTQYVEDIFYMPLILPQEELSVKLYGMNIIGFPGAIEISLKHFRHAQSADINIILPFNFRFDATINTTGMIPCVDKNGNPVANASTSTNPAELKLEFTVVDSGDEFWCRTTLVPQSPFPHPTDPEKQKKIAKFSKSMNSQRVDGVVVFDGEEYDPQLGRIRNPSPTLEISGEVLIDALSTITFTGYETPTRAESRVTAYLGVDFRLPTDAPTRGICKTASGDSIAHVDYTNSKVDQTTKTRISLVFTEAYAITDIWTCSVEIIAVSEPTRQIASARYFNGQSTFNMVLIDYLVHRPRLIFDTHLIRAGQPAPSMSTFSFYYDTRILNFDHPSPFSTQISLPFNLETFPFAGIFCSIDGGKFQSLPVALTSKNNVVSTYTVPTEWLIVPQSPRHSRITCYFPNLSTAAQPHTSRGRLQVAETYISTRLSFHNVFAFSLGYANDQNGITWVDDGEEIALNYRGDTPLFFRVQQIEPFQAVGFMHSHTAMEALTSLIDTLSDHTSLELELDTSPGCVEVNADDPLNVTADNVILQHEANRNVGDVYYSSQAVVADTICRITASVKDIHSSVQPTDELAFHLKLPYNLHAHHIAKVAFTPTVEATAIGSTFNSITKIIFVLYGFTQADDGSTVTIQLANGGKFISTTNAYEHSSRIGLLSESKITYNSEDDFTTKTVSATELVLDANFQPQKTYTIHVYCVFPLPADVEDSDLHDFALAEITAISQERTVKKTSAQTFRAHEPSVAITAEPIAPVDPKNVIVENEDGENDNEDGDDNGDAEDEEEPTPPPPPSPFPVFRRGVFNQYYAEFFNQHILPGSYISVPFFTIKDEANESPQQAISKFLQFPNGSTQGTYCFNPVDGTPIAAMTFSASTGVDKIIHAHFLFSSFDATQMKDGNVHRSIDGTLITDTDAEYTQRQSLIQCYFPLKIKVPHAISTPTTNLIAIQQMLTEFDEDMIPIDEDIQKPIPVTLALPTYNDVVEKLPSVRVTISDDIEVTGKTAVMTIEIDHTKIPMNTILGLKFVAAKDSTVPYPVELYLPVTGTQVAVCKNALYSVRHEEMGRVSPIYGTGITGIHGAASNQMALIFNSATALDNDEFYQFRCNVDVASLRPFPGEVDILAKIFTDEEARKVDQKIFEPSIQYDKVGKIDAPIGIQSFIEVGVEQASTPLARFTLHFTIAVTPSQFGGVLGIDLFNAYLAGLVGCDGYPNATYATVFDPKTNTRNPTLYIPLREIGDADINITCEFLASRHDVGKTDHVLHLYHPSSSNTAVTPLLDLKYPTITYDNQKYTSYANYNFEITAPLPKREAAIIHEFAMLFPRETYVDGTIREQFYSIIVKYIRYRVSNSIEHLTATLDPTRIYMMSQIWEPARSLSSDNTLQGRLTLRVALRDLSDPTLVVTDKLNFAAYQGEILALFGSGGSFYAQPTFLGDTFFYEECEVLSRCGGNCERCINNDICYLDADCRSGYCQKYLEKGIEGNILSTSGLCAPAPPGYLLLNQI